jgi:hypothetical protein
MQIVTLTETKFYATSGDLLHVFKSVKSCPYKLDTSSSFSFGPDDGSNTFLRNGILLQYYICHNPKDYNLKTHRCENFKTYMAINVWDVGHPHYDIFLKKK